MSEKAQIIIRGKKTTFTTKTLKNGEKRYYRNGKLTKTPYSRRIARAILSGKTLKEARGHVKSDFGLFASRRLTAVEIAREEEFHLGEWAAPPRNDRTGKQRHRYYAKVSVTSDSFRQAGSDPSGDACTPSTLLLLDADTGLVFEGTVAEASRNFQRMVMRSLERYGLTLCNGSLEKDLIAIWRHS